MGLKLPPSVLLGNTCCHLVSLWWTNPPTLMVMIKYINTRVEGSVVRLLTEKVNNSK